MYHGQGNGVPGNHYKNFVMDEVSSSTGSDSPSKIADLVEKDIEALIRNDTRTPKILK